MVKYFITIMFCFQNLIVFSQTNKSIDTIYSDLMINFNKVKPSFKETSTAQMQISYLKEKKIALVKFDVPSFWYRYNTSLADYCVVETLNNKLQLVNQVEAFAKGIDKNIYSFTYFISKDSLITLLSSNFKKITFYFTPNGNVENSLSKMGIDLTKQKNSKLFLVIED